MIQRCLHFVDTFEALIYYIRWYKLKKGGPTLSVDSPNIDQHKKSALHFRVRHSLVHHQWARQEFSPVRLSACKASILLRKTARAVVRRARRTLFAPRFRSRSIVAPAHKPATIFSDQSPRDEHERLREVRVRPGGNGATKKPQHSLRLFLVHHRGLSRALKTPQWGVFARRTGGGPELFSSPDGAPD